MVETARRTLISLVNDPKARGYASQATLVVGLAAILAFAARNAYINMDARGIPLGFGFWDQIAGFDINQKLIAYTPLSTYGRAFWVGLSNTALVGASIMYEILCLVADAHFRADRRAARR